MVSERMTATPSRSAPVTTLLTPGARAARVVSIARMRACAWGERTKATWSVPESWMSST